MGMPWLDSLNLGLEGFDDDHHHLFDVLIELNSAAEAGDASCVRALLAELQAATIEHLQDEEALMVRIRYPAMADHVASHDNMRLCLHELQCIMARGRLDQVADALAAYSTAYFRGVLRHDGLLAAYLNGSRMPVPGVGWAADPGTLSLPG